MDKVVEGDRSSSVLPDFLVGDKLLLLVHGEANAGVDLTELKPSDVAVRGKTVLSRTLDLAAGSGVTTLEVPLAPAPAPAPSVPISSPPSTSISTFRVVGIVASSLGAVALITQ